MRALAIGLVVTLVLGCGVQPGSKYAIDYGAGGAPCYASEEDFRDYLEKKRAGVGDNNAWLKGLVDGRMVSPSGGDRVTVIKAVPGGAKVHIDSGTYKGFDGYMEMEGFVEPSS